MSHVGKTVAWLLALAIGVFYGLLVLGLVLLTCGMVSLPFHTRHR